MSSVKPISQLTQKEFDEKMKKSIKMLKESYAKELAKKKSIKVIPFDDRPQIIEAPKPKKELVKKTKVAVKKENVVLCHATKMDGHKCTAKAKPGSKFCGRHMPKK